ncbi:MAG: ATP-binding protein, partial [Bacteroidales bacterium]|nr:ATP-binding protein [Bacteroidales bacterium]
LIKPNGDIRHIESNSVAMVSEDECPAGFVGSIQDVTERMHAEQKLKDSEEKFKRIFTSIQDGYFMIDLSGIILSVNPAAVHMLQYDKEDDLIGLDVKKSVFASHDDFETLSLILGGAHKVNNYQIDLKRKNEEIIIADCNFQLLYNDKETPWVIEGTFRNSTERIWIEEALKSALNLNKIMEKYTTKDLVNYGLEEAVRLTRSKIGFFHFVNEEAGTISLQTWSKETLKQCEVPGKEEHYPVEVAGIWVDSIRKRRPVIHNNYAEEKHKKGLPEGHFPLIREIVVPIFEGDKIVAVIGVGNKSSEYDQFDLNQLLLVSENIWSIIRRKRAEDELIIAKDVAESANMSKSIFLANMSHEIRTPLNAVLGFSDLLHSRVKDPLNKNYVESIKTSGKTLLNLINDILDLSKIEAGKLTISPEPIYLRQIFTEIENIFSLKAEQKQITLSFDLEKRLEQSIEIDELRLRQILLNLVGNAIKFTSIGYVEVAATIDNFDEKANSADIRIDVIDTGIGIPEDAHDKIFESFKQQDEQDERKYGGTGLGLAISKRLIELMDGNIEVNSEPGKGSIFSTVFKNVKFLEKASVQHEAFNHRKIRFHPHKVVLIEDDMLNQVIIDGYLEKSGLELIIAGGGREGVELVKEHHPMAILTDIRMPGMDGYETAEKIREIEGMQDTPIIAVTATANIYHADTNKNNIFYDQLKKPVSINELYKVLSKIIPYEYGKDDKVMLVDLNDKEIQNLHIVFDQRDKIYNKWLEIKNAHDIDVFTLFAEYLVNIGKESGNSVILKYANKLNEYIASFDLENIQTHVASFDGLLKKLESIYLNKSME